MDYLFVIGCVVFGLFLIGKVLLSKNGSGGDEFASEMLPAFIFKSPEDAFEYIKKYVTFPSSVVSGIVRRSTVLENHCEILEVECLFSDGIFLLKTCLNLLEDKVKLNDLVVCFDPNGSPVVGCLLSLEFNLKRKKWIVAAAAGKYSEIKEIPVLHSQHGRSFSQILSRE